MNERRHRRSTDTTLTLHRTRLPLPNRFQRNNRLRQSVGRFAKAKTALTCVSSKVLGRSRAAGSESSVRAAHSTARAASGESALRSRGSTGAAPPWIGEPARTQPGFQKHALQSNITVSRSFSSGEPVFRLRALFARDPTRASSPRFGHSGPRPVCRLPSPQCRGGSRQI